MAEKSTYDLASELGALLPEPPGAYLFLQKDLNDTSVVILATSLLDKLLKVMILSKFRSGVVTNTFVETIFTGGNGPLASFAGKTHIAVGLGLVRADVRHDLKIIRDIRNDFAHSHTELVLANFSGCRSLKLRSNLAIDDQPIERARFKHSCAAIVPHLAMSAIINVAEARVLESHSAEVRRIADELFNDTIHGD